MHMNTVVIDGVTYTKTGTLAKQFRYTTDYIGQLCRSGKVDAKLVGRSWYVSEQALADHSSKRLETVRQDEIALQDKSFSGDGADIVRIIAPLSKTTKKMLRNSFTPSHVMNSFATIRYEPDPVDLLPVISMQLSVPKIKQPDAKISISDLSSKITSSNLQNDLASFPVTINQHRPIKIKVVEGTPDLISHPSTHYHTNNVTNQAYVAPAGLTLVSAISAPTVKNISFIPTSVTMSKLTSVHSSFYVMSLIAVLVVGVGVIIATLALDMEVQYSGAITTTNFSFNQTALVNLFK